MEEDLKTLGDYISIAWRRKYLIVVPFVLVLTITVVTMNVLPPVYRSTGTILVESQQIPQELIQSTVTSFAEERIQIIRQRIMTSQQLFDIINKFDLYADTIRTTPRSEILAEMRDRILIEQVSADIGGSRRRVATTIAFTVSFEHQTPAIAQKVANELVTLFLAENIKSRTERAEETSRFLRRESERLGAEIAKMEGEIAAYKQENEGSLPESLRLNLERVVTLKSIMLESERELNELNERRKLLLIDLATIESQGVTQSSLSEQQQRQKEELKRLQTQFISLSARYGPEHPDVKAIKRQIAAFESEYGNLSDMNELNRQRQTAKENLLELSRNYSPEHPDYKKQERKLEGIETMIAEFQPAQDKKLEQAKSNPLLLQTRARLESVEASIARLEKGTTELQQQIDRLEVRISRTPQVERGLDTLERDYENMRTKYQEVKANQLQAELSESLEEDQKGERFALLEPPLLPDVPVKPDRPKLFFIGFALAVFSGIGFATIAEMLDGGIRGSKALARVTKMTPLVSVPYIATMQDQVRRKRNFRLLMIALICVALAGLAAVHFIYKPLDLLWYIALQNLKLT